MLYRMKRVRTTIFTLIVLASITSGVLAWNAQRALTARPYTVAQVQAALAHDRRAWGGHVIRIRGTVTTMQETFPCMKPSCALVGIADSIDAAPAAVLWLGQEGDNPFWAAVRRLPLVGHIAPRQQQPIVAQPDDYRIRLLAHPDCSGMHCYDAVLLDAQPPAAPNQAAIGGGAATPTPSTRAG